MKYTTFCGENRDCEACLEKSSPSVFVAYVYKILS
jgi:hypothetical protein